MVQCNRPDLCVQRDLDSLSRAAAEGLAELARHAVEARGGFTLALCGGTTIRHLLGLLATDYREDVPWARTSIFWSDERYVSPEDEESNYGLAKRVLLDRVGLSPERAHPTDPERAHGPSALLGTSRAPLRGRGISPEQVHAMPTLLPSPEEAAEAYEEELIEQFGGQLPRFDLMLMGMGPDGHTASLFPGSWALKEESRLVVAVTDAPKAPPVRLTMTYPVFNNAENLFFLVSGAEKHDALEHAAAGPEDRATCPASAIRPVDGAVMWWVDEAAFGAGRRQRAA